MTTADMISIIRDKAGKIDEYLELQKKYEELKKENDELKVMITEKDYKFADLQEQVDMLRTEADAVNRVLNIINEQTGAEQRVDYLEGELEAAENGIEFLKEKLAETERERDAMISENGILRRRLADIAYVVNVKPDSEYEEDELPF